MDAVNRHERVAPSTRPWFPRPSSPSALALLGPSGELDAIELFDLLLSRAAVERRDGAAEATTRLLSSEGWVFRTDTSHAELEPHGPRARLAMALAVAKRVELWHPDKRWFLLRTHGGPKHPERPHWWPVSVCPRLRSLRSIDSWPEFYTRWAAVIGFALQRSTRHGVGVELDPANFGVPIGAGVDEVTPGCCYLDDELRPPLVLGDLAAAIIERIPEWPEVDAPAHARYGAQLRGLLEPLQLVPGRFASLREELADVPLAPRWDQARAALLDGLGPPRSARAACFGPGRARRTAVLADVHANLSALEAVLADAERRGVNSFLLLGDLVGYGPDPVACVERVRALPATLALRGNHDHMACFGVTRAVNELARTSMEHTQTQLGPAQRAYLMGLPLELRGREWIAVHGAPIDPERYRAYVYDRSYRANLDHLLTIPQRLCFHGHTHLARVYHRDGPGADAEVLTPRAGTVVDLARPGVTMANPGSVGQPRDGDPRASYLIWDRRHERLEFRRVAYDLRRTRLRLRSEGLPESLGARLVLGS